MVFGVVWQLGGCWVIFGVVQETIIMVIVVAMVATMVVMEGYVSPA